MTKIKENSVSVDGNIIKKKRGRPFGTTKSAEKLLTIENVLRIIDKCSEQKVMSFKYDCLSIEFSNNIVQNGIIEQIEIPSDFESDSTGKQLEDMEEETDMELLSIENPAEYERLLIEGK